MSLEEIERTLSGTSVRVPSDVVLVRETSRALRAMSSGGDFATITCEPGIGGERITGGREALEVARVLRARATWRGDHFWACELGRQLRFRIVRTAPTRQPRRWGKAARLASRGVRLAAN